MVSVTLMLARSDELWTNPMERRLGHGMTCPKRSFLQNTYKPWRIGTRTRHAVSLRIKYGIKNANKMSSWKAESTKSGKFQHIAQKLLQDNWKSVIFVLQKLHPKLWDIHTKAWDEHFATEEKEF